MAVALDQFVKQLTDSGVIARGKLENFIPPNAAPKDAQELARLLVQSKQLTKFQAQEIYQGRAKSLILGNYTILDKIGAGGMGQVFKAHHRRMDRIVAIKVLPKNLTKDPPAIARFEQEVRAAARLSHPNIVAAYDADEANGVHFLVMEYVEGQDLSVLLKKDGPLSLSKATNFILQAARGLEFAHAEGVIHRDIKPANLLVDKKGVVKILDMGLARIEAGGDMATQAELTGTGAVMGTVDYMAPEQALSTKHATAQSDIYSLGCTLYYLLTGQAAYDGDSLMAKLLAHREQPIPSLGVNVPRPVQTVFEKMVAKNVEHRYQSMSEAVAALETCNSGQSTSLSPRQSVGTRSGSHVLTFLRNVTLNTIHPSKLKAAATPVQGAASSKFGRGNQKRILVAVGVLGLAILAGVIFKLKTNDGTLVVEIDQPDAVVEVLNEAGTVEITRPGEKGTVSIAVDPGQHRLKVEKDGFIVFGKDFVMESGGKQSIKATLVEDKPWFKPAFRKWQEEVVALLAEQQVEAVAQKLQELNPGFDGKVEKKIESGVVTELRFVSDNVTDLSPVRALAGLNTLYCGGSAGGKGTLSDLAPLEGMRLTHLECARTRVSDLSPLKGMPLTSVNFSDTKISDLSPLRRMPLKFLDCSTTPVSDLSPLQGMPLVFLNCTSTQVSDLSPLQGMPLTQLYCGHTPVSDLSPLQGMPLTQFLCPATPVSDLSPLSELSLIDLQCHATQVSDLSPLEGMKLGQLVFTPQDITKGIDVIRRMKSLARICIGLGAKDVFPPEEFWKKYDAGDFGAPTPSAKPVTTLKDPAFKRWQREVAKLPAEKQVDAVSKKLQELNPEFDGKETHKIEGGMVTELSFSTDSVTDISPVRALAGLKSLNCGGSGLDKGRLTDLSPLHDMPLTNLNCGWSPDLCDLSPLRGLPLTSLICGGHTQVSDLSPLKGMPLTVLYVNGTHVFDLSPLRGLPLKVFFCGDSHVTDLSPLAGMNLEKIWFTPGNITTGIDAIRQMKTITAIHIDWYTVFPPDEFWKKYEAGDFGDPLSRPVTPTKPITTFNDPAFKTWMKTVASLPAEQQVEAVVKKLQELNPEFDGKETHQIDGGVVTALDFSTHNVSDISPVRALSNLKRLGCQGTPDIGELEDLSPIEGLRLEHLWINSNKVHDLTPLKGMPLIGLTCYFTRVRDLAPIAGLPLKYLHLAGTPVHDIAPLGGMNLELLYLEHTKIKDIIPLKGMLSLQHLKIGYTHVSDLSPLRGLPLVDLECDVTPVADLRPLKGMKLVELHCNGSRVSDLSVIADMPLEDLWLDFRPQRDAQLLRSLKSLISINSKPAVEFWKELKPR